MANFDNHLIDEREDGQVGSGIDSHQMCIRTKFTGLNKCDKVNDE